MWGWFPGAPWHSAPRAESQNLCPAPQEEVAMARTTLLCCLLLAAAGGPEPLPAELPTLLVGLRGQSLAFPPPDGLESADISRVLWSTGAVHIAEAKPREKLFKVDLLPRFRRRLLLHPSNLSLEMRALREQDEGFYQLVVDTFSDPTNPRTSSYFVQVLGSSPWTAAGPTATGGRSRSTVGPQGVTKPHASDTTGGQGLSPWPGWTSSH
ncbi:uncharacterized protein [Melanerpes formicivorus]|uniref:uncharacterized protein n=1 Tax=Melanerpes formicivorus TaxID=211600 RepID=UPI00358F60B8